MKIIKRRLTGKREGKRGVWRAVKKQAIGKITAAASEAMEIIWVAVKTNIQNPKVIPAGTGAAARKTPRETATPFPPFKESQGEKVWPKIAKMPNKSSQGVPSKAEVKMDGRRTAADPLRAS